ncbi:MAG: hypothetical protein A2138_07565 [Deltaproteobacteria bacterium RBG_16_71_12]|nr:MAG: hypothetical protein A2138_07565 [Deltaproteobacteria bacterium RBG_16_71_12]
METVLGGTTHAGELGDASPEARTQLLEALVAWRKDLEGQMSESRERTLDARVLAASLELFRFGEEEVGLRRHDPDVATPLCEALLYHLRGHCESEPARFESLAARLRAVPRWFESQRAGVTSPSPELLARARDVVDGLPDLLRAVVDAARVASANGALVPALHQEVAAAAEVAGAGAEAQRRWLIALEPTPHAPLGLKALDQIMHLRGLDLTAAEVLDISRSIAEELRVEQARVIRRGYRGRTPDEAVAAARSANKAHSLGEAMAWLTDLTLASRQFLAGAGLPQPVLLDDRVVVDVMPAVLAPSGWPALLLPPQPRAARQESLLLLREPLGPQSEALLEISVPDLEGVCASLAYPGRHLQAVWAHVATSFARRGVPLSTISTLAGTWGLDMVNGWALTSEELMREAQFRSSASSRLIMIRRALLQTLLAAVDVCLAIGRFQPEQAAAFLVRRAGVRLPQARALVRGLLRAPTTGLSALVGKVRIEQLRREARRRWRDGYSEKRFNTLMLANGPIPLAYLFERLNDPPAFVTDVPTASFVGAPTA